MISSIFSRPLGESAAPVLSPDEVASQAKAARVKFHRDNVRNGPVRFGNSRSERRQAAIDRKSMNSKRRRNRVRSLLGEQRELAVLRGQLQAVGSLPYADENFRPSQGVVEASVQGFFARAGIDRSELAAMPGPVLQERLSSQILADRHRYLEAMES